MTQRAADLLRCLHRVAARSAASDAALLRQYVTQRDGEAFAELVRRHGPLVWGVCRRALGCEADAEDAFQATFLALARQAPGLRRPEALAAWLHGVARRVALKTRAAADRRRRHEQVAARPAVAEPPEELTVRELLAALDEEVQRLPETYRLPLLLCYWQGRTQDEAARQLGWTTGSVRGRLDRARALLRPRLARRGLALSTALGVALLGRGSVPAGTLARAARAATAPTTVSPAVAVLADTALPGVALNARRLALAALAVALLGGGVVLLGGQAPPAHAPGAPPPATATAPRLDRYGDPLPEGAMARLGTTRFLHDGAVRAVAFSPDDSTIASGGDDNLIRLWDAATGRELRQLRGHQNWIYTVAFSPDGKTLASGGPDQTIRLWDPATGKELRRLTGHQGAVNRIAFSPDGLLLASGGDDRTLRLWEVATGRELRQGADNRGRITSVAFFPDGRRLVSASSDDGISLWDAATGKRVGGLGEPGRPAYQVAVSPDGAVVASTHETRASLWEVATGKRRYEITSQSKEVFRVVFSPDGRALAVGSVNSRRSGENRIGLFDPATGKELRRLVDTPGTNYNAQALAFSHDGRRLASGSFDHRVRLWEVDSGRLVHPFEGHPYAINAAAYSPDGRTLVTASLDRTLRLWDIASGRERHCLDGYQGWGPASVLFTPEGQTVVGTAPDGLVRRWAAASGKQVTEYGTGGDPYAEALCVSHEGKLLAAGIKDQEIRVWEVVSGKEVVALPQVDEFPCLIISPDGRFLACQGFAKFRPTAEAERRHNVLHVWRVATGKEIDRFAGLRVPLSCPVAFSPDGNLLAAEDEGGDIDLWEVATGARRGRLAAQVKPRQPLCSLAFSPDGRCLAAGRWKGEVWLWEVMTGREVRRWRGHQARVFGLAFAPDGRTLASASEDATALLWDVTGSTDRPASVEPGELAALWSELGEADAATAHRALWRLVAAGGEAVPFLEERLRSLGPGAGPEERIARLIARLDDDRFESRQQVAEELGRLGRVCEPALRTALRKGPSPETCRRIERILDDLEGRAWPPDVVHGVRAVQVLEQVGTPAARNVLKMLAEGAPERPLTQEAKASLARLGQR